MESKQIEVDCQYSTSFIQHAEKLEKYALAHQRNLAFADWLVSNYPLSLQSGNLAQDLEQCGSHLYFHWYFEQLEYRLIRSYSCDHSNACLMCAIRRGGRYAREYLERFEAIKALYPNLKPYLVTLTVRGYSGASLADQFEHLQNCFRTYQQQARNAKKRRRPPVELNKALGVVGSYETKIGEGLGAWHPHIHMIWLCEDEPNKHKLRSEWQEITLDSFECDIKSMIYHEDSSKDFIEVFKYAVCFNDLTFEQNYEAYNFYKGRHLIFSFGLFRGVPVIATLNDEPLKDAPFIILMYNYSLNSNRYILSQTEIGERISSLCY